MQLPGRLDDTTLGDVLGTLLRSRATGFLELIESSGPHAGRHHLIELRDGQVADVQSETPSPRLGDLLELDQLPGDSTGRLGESLLARGLITEEQLRGALSRQLQQRLERLFSIQRAELRFRAPRPRSEDPTAPRPLGKEQVLHGRPRARQRPEAARAHAPEAARLGALRTLNLPADATRADVQRAFRRLARETHPDRHPRASSNEKFRLLKRFSELSRAYHALNR